MIRKSVLKARAAHGYAWLQEIGPYFGLDVQRLHLRPELINVASLNWCPLSHSDTGDAFPGRPHFHAICGRLLMGRIVGDTGKNLCIHKNDLNAFLNDHGFDIMETDLLGKWGFLGGMARDWRVLTQAWRDVITANKPAAAEGAPK